MRERERDREPEIEIERGRGRDNEKTPAREATESLRHLKSADFALEKG